MSEWQPIETAPRGRTPILLASPDGHIGIGYIELSEYSGRPSSSQVWAGERAWGGIGVWLGGIPAHEATHWQPLPEPPAAAPLSAVKGTGE